VFAKLTKKFVVLHLDTRNGRAAFVKRLKVERNQTYALVLKQNGHEIARIVNPEKLKEIIDLLTRVISGEAKRENYPPPLTPATAQVSFPSSPCEKFNLLLRQWASSSSSYGAEGTAAVNHTSNRRESQSCQRKWGG